MARATRARARSARPAAQIVDAGDSACLVRLGEGADPATTARVHALLAALDDAPAPEMRDVVPAYASLLVHFDPLVTTREAITAAIHAALARAARSHGATSRPARVVEIPVEYGGAAGPDLEEVARLVGLPTDEVVRRHTSAAYDVAFLGFIAGFPYLSGLPEALRVPRLETPRTLVPAGSVAIAGGQTGIYPVASPGGWRVIGRTPLRLFDPAADPPALLRPGDRVRFVATAPEMEPQSTQRSQRSEGEEERGAERVAVAGEMLHEDSASASPASMVSLCSVVPSPDPAGGVPWLRVIRPGPLATVQDGGRWSYARYGVSVSGAADADALRLGNLLLGNPRDAAALEITLGGAAFEALAPCRVALTGADCPARVNGRPAPGGVAVELHPGQTLEVEMARSGMRAYLCVAGGVVVPTLLGSRSTDLRAGFGGLGGRALRAGDELRRGEDAQLADLPSGRRLPPDPARRASGDGVHALRVLPGPHGESAPGVLEALVAGEYTVDPRSDRMGVRLRWTGAGTGGPAEATRPRGGQIVSEGVPRGAIQLPPDGEPILLLAEHQTTGGYLIPAVVISADQRRVGQLRPGERVRFTRVSEVEAISALRDRASWLATATRGAAAVGGAGVRGADITLLARGFAEWDEASDATMAADADE